MENQSTRSAAWTGGSKLLVGILSLAVAGVVAAAVVTKGGRTVEATIPAGTSVVGALEHTISTANSDAGETVALKTTEPMQLSAGALPAGAVLHGEVTHVKGGGRIAGAPELTLRFTRLEVDGNEYPIAADPWRVKGKDDLGESVAEIGGGAVVGGVVGGIAGHGSTKGIVTGAAVGAVLGTGVAVATKGGQIVLPAGQRLKVRLADAVKVKYEPEKS
ncbi:MAG TPA: hypothetical protein VFU03_08655 [Gemmatimonadales bacterium]|nr:hypothetical protein [Gemmatimonadales bacterium]